MSTAVVDGMFFFCHLGLLIGSLDICDGRRQQTGTSDDFAGTLETLGGLVRRIIKLTLASIEIISPSIFQIEFWKSPVSQSQVCKSGTANLKLSKRIILVVHRQCCHYS